MYLRIIIGLLAALIATSAFAADNFDSLWQSRVEQHPTFEAFALVQLPEATAFIKAAQKFDIRQFNEDVERIERHRRHRQEHNSSEHRRIWYTRNNHKYYYYARHRHGRRA